jgi:hypothetical protein
MKEVVKGFRESLPDEFKDMKGFSAEVTGGTIKSEPKKEDLEHKIAMLAKAIGIVAQHVTELEKKLGVDDGSDVECCQDSKRQILKG